MNRLYVACVTKHPGTAMTIFDITFAFSIPLHLTSFPEYTRAGLQVLKFFFSKVIFQNKKKISGSLTFILPCIASISLKYNQRMQRFLFLLISIYCSTCFRLFLRPSSGAQNCTYSVRYCQNVMIDRILTALLVNFNRFAC